MTDPEVADKTYIEPITLQVLEEVIKKEKPDAILPTMGGQTALNLAIKAEEVGLLNKYKIEGYIIPKNDNFFLRPFLNFLLVHNQ